MPTQKHNFTFVPVSNYVQEIIIDDWARINLKSGAMRFSPSYVKNNNYEDEALRFFWDENKKALGWKRSKRETIGTLPDCVKMVTINTRGESKQYGINIKKLLKRVGMSASQKTEKLHIKTLDNAIMGESLDYVIIELPKKAAGTENA